MHKILSKLIIFLFNKSPKIKEDILRYIAKNELLKEELDSTKKIVKEEEKVLSEKEKQKRLEEFLKVEKGDVIYAKVPVNFYKGDVKDKSVRPWVVIKKYDDTLTVVARSTSKRNMELKELDSMIFVKKEDDVIGDSDYVINCEQYYVISKDNFICNKGKISNNLVEEIIRKQKVYNSRSLTIKKLNFKIKENDIIEYKDDKYFVYDVNKNEFYCYKLTKSSNNKEFSYGIFGENYTLEPNVVYAFDNIYEFSNNMSLLSIENEELKKLVKRDLFDYNEKPKLFYMNKNKQEKYEKSLVKEEPKKEEKEKIKKEYYKKYKLGDILSIKDSKEKVIYVSSYNDKLYYLTMDNLDFFTGISRKNLNDVHSKYGEISEDSIKKILIKIERMLNSKSDILSSDVVNSAKEVVKTLGPKYK